MAIKDSTIELGKKIIEARVVEGNSVLVDGEVFEKNLPEGLDVASIKKYREYQKQFGNALAYAVSETAVEDLKNHDEIVWTAGAVASDKFKVRVLKTSEDRNPQTGETVTTHGAMRLKFQSTAVGGAELTQIKKTLNAKAAAAFSS